MWRMPLFFVIVFAGALESPKTQRVLFGFSTSVADHNTFVRWMPPLKNCPNRAAGSCDLWCPMLHLSLAARSFLIHVKGGAVFVHELPCLGSSCVH